MAVNSQTPATEVEGIGPTIARALARIRVYTVYDLLRCTPDQIRRAASARLSFPEAYALRAAASLLQVRGMTGQWAEGLVKEGVKSIEEFHRKSSREVLEALRRARRRRIIRSLPASGVLEEMLKDAVVLQHTGALVGTVRDAKGKPVRGAVVQIGRDQQRTNARGRFHLLRLPLGRPLPLRIDHPRFQPLVMEEPRILLDCDVVAVQIFTLKRLRRNAIHHRARPTRLSELDGDTLPTPTGQPLHVVPISPDTIQGGDIFMVQNIPKGRAAVKLVSRFKGFENGTFIVRTVKIPRERLPADLRERDHVRYVLGEFRSAQIDAGTIRREIMLRVMRKEFAGRRIGGRASQRRRAIGKRIQFLAGKGFFSGRLLLPGGQARPSREGGIDDV